MNAASAITEAVTPTSPTAYGSSQRGAEPSETRIMALEQAGAFRDGHGQQDRHHRHQRREVDEVRAEVDREPGQSFAGEQPAHGGRLVGARDRDRDVEQLQHRRDHPDEQEQPEEQQERVRQLVADTFDAGQQPVGAGRGRGRDGSFGQGVAPSAVHGDSDPKAPMRATFSEGLRSSPSAAPWRRPRGGCWHRAWRPRWRGSCARCPARGAPAGDLLDRRAVGGGLEHVGLARGERRVAGGDRLGGELGVDVPPAGVHDPHHLGEGGGRGGLRQEAVDPAGEGALEVAGAPVAGDDQARHSRARRARSPATLDAVAVGHLQVEHGHVGTRRAGSGEGLGAVGGLGDDLEVVLEVEHLGEGAADQVLVVGEQHADHRRALRRRRVADQAHAHDELVAIRRGRQPRAERSEVLGERAPVRCPSSSPRSRSRRQPSLRITTSPSAYVIVDAGGAGVAQHVGDASRITRATGSCHDSGRSSRSAVAVMPAERSSETAPSTSVSRSSGR